MWTRTCSDPMCRREGPQGATRCAWCGARLRLAWQEVILWLVAGSVLTTSLILAIVSP